MIKDKISIHKDEPIKEQIERLYAASTLMKEYIPAIESHKNGEISDLEFVFICKQLRMNRQRGNFMTLERLKEETALYFQKNDGETNT